MKLAGKTAVVTGGGSGIGRAIAGAFAREGCRVVICGRDEEKLRAAATDMPADAPAQGSLLAHPADVADRQSVATFFDWATDQLGQIDILVNNAGVNIKNRTMAEMNPEDWDHLFNVNATGTYNCIYQVLPQMRERQDGLIINISSVAGRRATLLGGIAYNATKHAQAALGIGLAQEVGGSGVRVTTFYPGEVNTPILAGRPVPLSDEHLASILQPEDLAEAALMVACLPVRAHVVELVMKATWQDFA